jgi:hypothetical protein
VQEQNGERHLHCKDGLAAIDRALELWAVPAFATAYASDPEGFARQSVPDLNPSLRRALCLDLGLRTKGDTQESQSRDRLVAAIRCDFGLWIALSTTEGDVANALAIPDSCSSHTLRDVM